MRILTRSGEDDPWATLDWVTAHLMPPFQENIGLHMPFWVWFHVGRNNAYYNRSFGCLPPIRCGIMRPLLYRIGYVVGLVAGPADKVPNERADL